MDKLKIEEYSEKLWQMHISVSGFYNDYAKSMGLTLAALKVITILYKNKHCTQKNITQLTYLPKQTVNAIIKGFEEQGYIKEQSELNSDKRNKTISLTNEGQKYAEKVILKAKDAEYRALEKLGEERRKALIEAITLYRENLSIED